MSKTELRRLHATVTKDLYDRLLSVGHLNVKFDSWLANLIEERLNQEKESGNSHD